MRICIIMYKLAEITCSLFKFSAIKILAFCSRNVKFVLFDKKTAARRRRF